MAKYNRDILVPYLRNICALELAVRKVNQQGRTIERKIQALEAGVNNPRPNSPYEEPEVTGGRVFCIVIGAFLALLELMTIIVLAVDDSGGELPFWASFLIVGASVFMFCAGIMPMRSAKQSNAERREKYQRDLDRYNRINCENQEQRKTNLPLVQRDRTICIAEHKKAVNARKEMYNANIIPMQYRNLYAAIYLYNWFSSSQADDLDMALNMFVLEEIKAKLDKIIENQSEIILNQCIAQAKQDQAMAQQQQHNEIMQNKLNQIAASAEEQTTYLNMIESNTKATAYFAAAEYLRKF